MQNISTQIPIQQDNFFKLKYIVPNPIHLFVKLKIALWKKFKPASDFKNAKMKFKTAIIFILLVTVHTQSCTEDYLKNGQTQKAATSLSKPKNFKHIGDIPPPVGYERVAYNQNTFATWLRQFPLRKNDTVYFYYGYPKTNQTWQYKVLDISTGNKDLQQCADAVMRLKAEYLFSRKAYNEINFLTSQGKELSFLNYVNVRRCNARQYASVDNHSNSGEETISHDCLMGFLENVFTNCGTYTLKLMGKPMIDYNAIAPGDYIVRAGSPGHAMMVADVVENKQNGKKMFMLLQGYMPAQDMHIVRNLSNEAISPWYEIENNEFIITPGYNFKAVELYKWK